eukprot:TRINITY_DN24127_c0_g1_i1.p1 TRINITY_DN24127_c0_g1~~TRINITY_DN24127_c0_g1_i1.p1  ORF type:complete len:766 (+),score=186.14 TRINITY_DN24127_c0_g1_i1:88-2385(+)
MAEVGGMPVVGSPSQALRKGRQSGSNGALSKKPERFATIEPIVHRPNLIPIPQTLNPLEIKSLGFDPRKSKDTIPGKQKDLQNEFSERGTAIAKQQCLAVNLITLLHQVVKGQCTSPTSKTELEEPLPCVEEIFQGTDDNILLLLQSHYTKLYQSWRATERQRLLPGISSLLSVAQERPIIPRRGLRAVYSHVREDRPHFPSFNLGSECDGISELFIAAHTGSGIYNSLAKLESIHTNLQSGQPRQEQPVSIEKARQAFLAGEATEAEKRVLREQLEAGNKEEAPGGSKEGLLGDTKPGEAVKKRRKSSGHYFTWGDCTVVKEADTSAADDVFMQDLAGSEDEKSTSKKKPLGRKKRLSVSINDEVEPTKIVDDQGVFHYGDFAIDTTGGSYDYSTYGGSGGGGSGAGSALDFAFGDFAIGVDAETVMKHEPQKLLAKNKIALSVPKKQPKPEGLFIVNYTTTFLIGHAARVKCVAISPDERHILSCSHEDVIVVLSDIKTGKEMVSFSGHDDTLTSVAFSDDQKHVATTSRDQNLILWDAITAKVLLQFEHDKVVICCAWSKSGRLIVSGCQDKVCRVWDTKKGKERAAFTEHTAIIISLDFAPDDKHIVSASADKTVRIWSAASGQSVKVLKGHSGIVLGCRYLPDGKQILSNDENEIKLWDVKTGACKLSMHVENIQMALPITRTKKRFTWTLCSSCPGDFGNYIIASCNLRTVIIFDRQTGEEVLTFYTRAPVYCLASSAHDKVVLGDSMGNIYVITLKGL